MREDERRIITQFGRGVVLLLVVQTAFMAGGLLVERWLQAPVTGVPSMVGMTLVLFISAMMSGEKDHYVLLGSFSLAFLAPLALHLVVRFKTFPVHEHLVHYSIGYLSALVVAVWIYFGVRILKGMR
jgi:hypothetical protein